MERRISIWLVGCLLLAAVASLAIATPTSAREPSNELSGRLTAFEGVSLQGSLGVQGTEGGVLVTRADSTDLGRMVLNGSRIDVWYSWEKGVQTDLKDGDPYYQHRLDEGTRELSFDEATARIEPDRGTPELLAVLSPGETRAMAQGTGSHMLRLIEDANLTRAGVSEDAIVPGSNRTHGFWYHVRGPWAGLHALDRAVVEGDFTLFLNNVTLALGSGEENGAWQHWTGVHTRPGPTPGTEEVESRITVISVTAGSLEVATERGVTLVAPSQSARLDGTLSADQVRGSLTTEALRYDFTGGPVGLEGTGDLQIQATPGGVWSGGSSELPMASSLVLETDGNFLLSDGSDVDVQQLAAPDEAGAGLIRVIEPGSTSALALIVLVGVVLAARSSADPLKRALSRRLAQRRRDRIRDWLATGDDWLEARDPAQALPWYRKVTEAYPNAAEGWTSLATCLEELGRLAEATAAYRRASDCFAGGDAFFLVAGAHCALRDGDENAALELGLEAADADPHEAAGALSERGLDQLLSEPRLADKLGLKTDAEASYYA